MTAPADMTNPEMDAAVAERVMQWTRDEIAGAWRWWHKSENRWCFRNTYDWSPTADPRDSRMVVERMRELGWVFELVDDQTGADMHQATFHRIDEYGAGEHRASNANEDRATCEAALEALGSEQCG